MMSANNVVICEDRKALSEKTAELWIEIAKKAVAGNGRCTVALSGGSTPRSLFELMETPQWSSRIDWQKSQIFWGDERYVPPDHPDSNFGMANKALLSK